MKADVSIDWCSFTLRCESWTDRGEKHSSGYHDVHYIIEHILRLKPEQFKAMPYGGRHGYRQGVAFEGIEIYFDGNSDTMGANVSMSGNGCATYSQHRHMKDLLERLHEGVLEGTINPTRLDVACDDHEGYLHVPRVIDTIRSKQLRSRATSRKAILDLDANDEERGETVYIGAERKSEAWIRIYDKAAEQRDKGKEYYGVWNRLEMVNRRDYARAMLDALVTGGDELGETVAGILADRIAFIERDDENISRCSLISWWREFIGEVKRIRLLFKEKPDMAIERLERYFGEELAACVYMLDKVLGDGYWQHVKTYGKSKLRQRHISILEQHIGELPGQVLIE
jgi:phage replication initiation protein